MPTRWVHCIYNIQIALIFKRKHCQLSLRDSADWS